MKIGIICVLLSWACVCGAQQPDSTAQNNPPAEQRWRGLRSNERTGIDIDRFIGHPSASVARVTHEVMLTQSILRAGDPYAPGDPGAVLEYRKDFAHVWLLPQNVTPLVELPLQLVFYVQSGSGRLDNGSL